MKSLLFKILMLILLLNHFVSENLAKIGELPQLFSRPYEW